MHNTTAQKDKGDVLASGSFDNTIKLWSMDPARSAAWEPLSTLTSHASKVFAVDIAADLSCMVSASYDRTWKVWAREV